MEICFIFNGWNIIFNPGKKGTHMRLRISILLLGMFLIVSTVSPADASDKLKVLIIDGQNNHDYKACTPILKWILEDSGRFTVDVSTTPPAAPRAPQAPKGEMTPESKTAQEAALAKWNQEKTEYDKTAPEQWQKWRPKFSNYAVVLCNYNGQSWPDEVRSSFVQYVRNGGGLVIYHAADNSFPDWPEYNEMSGVGGWGGRNEQSGPMIYWADGKIVLDNSPGAGGTHGPQHEFAVDTRDPDHPIMKGLPIHWKNAIDELYSKMRGPAKNMTVLATAYAAPEQKGTGKNEPILMVISYGKGRIFHTVLGHGPKAISGLGFQVTLLRGTEWAATGKVTIPAPGPEQLPADRAATREPPENLMPAK